MAGFRIEFLKYLVGIEIVFNFMELVPSNFVGLLFITYYILVAGFDLAYFISIILVQESVQLYYISKIVFPCVLVKLTEL